MLIIMTLVLHHVDDDGGQTRLHSSSGRLPIHQAPPSVSHPWADKSNDCRSSIPDTDLWLQFSTGWCFRTLVADGPGWLWSAVEDLEIRLTWKKIQFQLTVVILETEEMGDYLSEISKSSVIVDPWWLNGFMCIEALKTTCEVTLWKYVTKVYEQSESKNHANTYNTL